MSTSITSSTSSPYTGLLFQDVNYTVSSSLSASAGVVATPSILFPNISFPEVGHFIVQVYNGTVLNTTSSLVYSMSLQHSKDNVTWVAIPQFSSTLLTTTDSGSGGYAGGTGSAGTAQVLLPPNVNPYVRAVAGIPANGFYTGGLNGTFGIQTLF